VTRKPLTANRSRRTRNLQAAGLQDSRRIEDEVRYNSEWLGKLGYEGIIRLATISPSRKCSNGTSSTSAFSRAAHQPPRTALPLMQAYDSVALECDVELGGTDQRFNLGAGRELQRHYGQKPRSF